ncbi:MAG TPA: type II toxin-antitoxin system prevent-host-death family antitoxin [Gemmatimonadaceae bacterium]|nr:type II toxin-antitoxin system prevent-host-death family antitoxin [Gemmatimonadaceae bacterium]
MSETKPKQVNLYEAKTHLSQLVKEAAAGREIIIANAGEPMARLVPLATEPKPLREPGQWKGRIWIADDFDDPLPEDILALFEGSEDGEIEPPSDTTEDIEEK